ncbi:MAG: hypothetical protein HY308_02200 [Gammaproteobacteria bacterium]|nr:hypothetical protein [Gammaproteobacteria bacterium]
MATPTKRHYFSAFLSAPAVAAIYWLITFLVELVGCMPAFADVDFFGVRVTVFLLIALTFAALILIIFAALQAVRVFRVAARRRHRDGLDPRLGVALAIVLALISFAVTVWVGYAVLRAPCGG